MHALHLILVKPGPYQSDGDIESVAFRETSFAAGEAYGCRQLEKAADHFREGAFPGNVVRQDRDEEAFYGFLDSARKHLEWQKWEYIHAVERRSATVFKELPDANELMDWLGDDSRARDAMTSLMKLYDGEYTFDARYYDVELGTSNLTRGRLAEVERRGGYALVLVDCRM